MASRAPKPLPYRPRHRRNWLRRHDCRRAQPVPTVAAMLTVFPVLRRAELERIAHRAIDQIDEIDGDPDREEDDWLEEDDWPGGNVEDEGQINEIEPYTGPMAGPGSRDIANERASRPGGRPC